MKRGPKPSGKAMTAAQRQARYRAAHADAPHACATAGLPTGAAWRRGGVMPWASSSICRGRLSIMVLQPAGERRCGQSVRSI
jgi:hypothetical protein